MSVLLTPVVNGQVFDGTAHNANLDQIENSLGDLGPYIISGLTVTAGAGLDVTVASGVASVGGRINKASSFSITGLSPSTTNHLYLLQNGTGTSNTSGTQPANSVKLGTAVTDAGTVTSVGQNWASGRQTKRRAEDLVHGSGAGYPRAVDIASWHATNNEGNEVKGTLPAGALPSSLNAPLTLTADDGSQSSVTRVLTLRHTYNAGFGANGIGAGMQFEAENTAGGNNVLGRLDYVSTSAVSANFTSQAELRVAKNNTDTLLLTLSPSGGCTFSESVQAVATYGNVNIGSGGFTTGVAPEFVGQSVGTLLALNTQNATVTLIDAQNAGVSRFRLAVTGEAYMPRLPGAEANFGTLNLGPGGFTGGANHFTGSTAGQVLAINSTSGFAGRLAEFQRGGVSVLRVVADGRVAVGTGGTLAAQLSVSRPAAAANPANPTYLRVDAVADTAMAAGTEVIDVDVRLNRTLEFATGALATQRAVLFRAPTYAFVGASTITDAATVAIDNRPLPGANVTYTKRHALWIQAGGFRCVGHLDLGGGSAVTAAAGANAGTTPPAPVVTAGSNDTRGNLTFGTGTTPAAGAMVVVTFAAPFAAAPYVLVVPRKSNTEALGLYVSATSTSSFTLSSTNAPAASQANTTYSFDYFVVE